MPTKYVHPAGHCLPVSFPDGQLPARPIKQKLEYVVVYVYVRTTGGMRERASLPPRSIVRGNYLQSVSQVVVISILAACRASYCAIKKEGRREGLGERGNER